MAVSQKVKIMDFDYAGATAEELFKRFKTSARGLSEEQAQERLEKYGHNEPAKRKKRTIFIGILSKFANPLVVVLLIIGGFSLFFGEKISALFVIAMAVFSVLLSFIQEHRASREAQALSEMVRATATVFRDGQAKEIKIREIAPGDIVDLCAGDMIPADLRIISCKDLFINQASLTGESFPIEKIADPVKSAGSSLADMPNIAFMGSSVVSGSATGLVVKTGISTQFGELSRRLVNIRVHTSFDKGVRRFTWLMIRFMVIMVIVIFAINAVDKHNWIEALLFSLAVAVGLTPEMLPMLVAMNLSKGAIEMSKKDVIVKRLNSIQNFGAMDVLCTDKTGTLTLDKIIIERYCNIVGVEDEDVLRYAYINSFYQTGLKNLLDRAILEHKAMAVEHYRKIDEIPFDFGRKIMSVVVSMDGKNRLLSKGAPEEIYRRCTKCDLDGEILPLDNLILPDLKEEYDNLSAEGFRVLGIAYKDMESRDVYSRDDENELILKGYVAFLDPPKPTAKEAIKAVANLGIEMKVLTGDNELVTKKICSEVGLDVKALFTGEQIDKFTDTQLREAVRTTTVFARLSPLQKERIIGALHDNGHIVGYLGDGINDAPALKASDVGISVDNAVDIARESADIILLKKNLLVLEDGVIEGRKTFGNIVKYIKMGSSSNLGNMISMTGASLLLPFLPMTPIQILLNNFLYDLSQTAISTDDVDQDYLAAPRPWNVDSIRRFMVMIGPISSIFDFVTFGVLLLLRAPQPLFHTMWFLESLTTQTLVIHIIRTGKLPFIESKPSKFLMLTSILIVGLGFAIPFSPLAHVFAFDHPPLYYYPIIAGIVLTYLAAVQVAKTWFARKYGYA
jgi:Mg2+-importing ATPase